MLDVRDIKKSFAGFLAVADVSFSLLPQAVMAIIGPNGAGKSTLFRMLMGVEKPDSGEINVGQTVPEMLKNDYGVELVAIPLLNRSIATCRDAGDHGTEELLRDILTSEEEHVDWLEAQLELVKQLGEANYLAQQIRD